MKTSYIDPSHQLTGDRPLTNDEAAVRVVDELHKAWQVFRHTHLRLDMMIVLERALYLQKLGYDLVLIKRNDCVGARKRATRPNGEPQCRVH
jgi:hypothetical protein